MSKLGRDLEREMDGKGRCANARSPGSDCDKSVIDQIMLRFRPIAPKPGGDRSSLGKSASESCDKISINGRKKRKYVRVRNQCERRKTKMPPGGETVDDNGESKAAATLQLLPERSDGEDLFAVGSKSDLDRHAESTRAFELPLVSLNFEEYYRNGYVAASAESVADVPPARAVWESTVTVECVTETFMDVVGGGGGGLRNGDGDRIKSLEVDTCPGFVSDGSNLVQWMNEAYKKMVRGEEDNEYQWPHQFRVCLVMKERLPYLYPVFACRVRLEYTWRERNHSRTMPCDVWRMDGGGFAWRLDVNAALSLALS